MTERGKLIVVSGPSGAGKSCLISKTMELRDDLCFSTSVTTRQARPGEIDGKDYFFIDPERFLQMINAGELLEHAKYVGNHYGTPRVFVEQKRDEGINVILDIEVQGARQVHEMDREAVMIFTAPPSLAELEKRLRGRGTETDETIRARLERARQEYAEADIYDYLIVNDDLTVAAQELSAIITASHCSFKDRKHILKECM